MENSKKPLRIVAKGEFSSHNVSMREDVRNVLESTPLVHMVTIDPDGRPQISLVWVGVEGDEVVVGSQAKRRKIHNLLRDDRVALSMLTGGVDERGLEEYLVIHGRASVSEGGAPEVLQRLAHKYVGPDAVFPPGNPPPDGWVTRVAIERCTGIGPWLSSS